MSKLNLINPQWQGGAEIATLSGTREIEEFYMKDAPSVHVPLSSGEDDLAVEHGIAGYRVIEEQTQATLAILRESGADRVFTVGGSCDADVASILYLSEFYNGNLAVLWLDAHGDINSPAESSTHLFYGMPVRMLLGGCGEAFTNLNYKPMSPRQFINVGGRALDAAEINFMQHQQIPLIPARGVVDLQATVMQAITLTGKGHLYIHLDLDVLDPADFPYTAVPVEAGLPLKQLQLLLTALRQKTDLVGFGIFEYIPSGAKCGALEQLVRFGLDLD